jgi:pimeloyl-ACP methyl ester carboxylesterase
MLHQSPKDLPQPLEGISGPALSNSLGELLTPLELAKLSLFWWRLPRNLKGYGKPVLLLPGLGAGERSMFVIREYLRFLGYTPYDWGLGRNGGQVEELLEKFTGVLANRHEEVGEPIALVGWSLGGVVAREAARDNPGAVSQVISLGTPLIGGPRYTSPGPLMYSQAEREEIEAKVSDRYLVPLEMPVTSIYSKRDGVVAWQASIDHWSPNVDNIEVDTTHFGFGFSEKVLTLLAEILGGKRSRL